jgi:hypothetical protein
MLQSMSLYTVLGLRGKKRGVSTHPCHIKTMVPDAQKSKLMTNILQLDQGYQGGTSMYTVIQQL